MSQLLTADPSTETLDRLQFTFPDAILIARRNNGDHLTFLIERPGSPFVREIVTPPDAPSTETRWTTIGHRARDWEVLHTNEMWAGWDLDAGPDDHLTDDEFGDLIAGLITKATGPAGPVHGTEPDTRFHQVVRIEVDTARRVGEPRNRRLIVSTVADETPTTTMADQDITNGRTTVTKVCYRWSKSNGAVAVECLGPTPVNRGDFVATVWENDEIAQRLDAEKARRDQAERSRNAIESLAARLDKGIVRQWERWVSAASFATYAETTGKTVSWKSWQELNPIPPFPFWLGKSKGATVAAPLIQLAIDLGMDVEGLTVGQMKRRVAATEPGARPMIAAMPTALDRYYLRLP